MAARSSPGCRTRRSRSIQLSRIPSCLCTNKLEELQSHQQHRSLEVLWDLALFPMTQKFSKNWRKKDLPQKQISFDLDCCSPSLPPQELDHTVGLRPVRCIGLSK